MTEHPPPSPSPFKDVPPPVALGRSALRNPYKKENIGEDFYDSDPMAPQIVAPLMASRSLQGLKNGVILYDQFAVKTKSPLFDRLKPSDIEPPNFQNLATNFINWIAQGNARKKDGTPYSLDSGTLPQYFSNWYNAICKDQRFRAALNKDPVRKWHDGMTELLTRRLRDDANKLGIIKTTRSTTLRRSSFIELIQYILNESQSDGKKQRNAWEVW